MEGRTLLLDAHYAEGDQQRLERLAAEVVRQRVDLKGAKALAVTLTDRLLLQADKLID